MSGIEYMRYMYDYLGDRYDTETVTQIYKTAFLNDNHIRFKPGIIHEDTLFMFEVLVEAQKIKVYDDVFMYTECVMAQLCILWEIIII